MRQTSRWRRWRANVPRLVSLDFFRRRLAGVDALPQLSILAIVTGLLTSAVMVVFRLAIELGTLTFLSNSEQFESLSPFAALLLPIAGALVIGLAMQQLTHERRQVGVTHVMERLSRHQGYMPLPNAVVQLFGGAATLIAGLSGGREGPAIHLGAASSSLLGQAFELPNNSIRTLIACGTAAAIAASFNTPIAGVIFAMEVVMMEYTIASFVPVILSSVTATVLTRVVFGDATAFIVPPFDLTSLTELPYVVLAGIGIGTVAALFIHLVQFFTRLDHWPYWSRATLAGALTGAAALITPAVLGIGYDTVNAALAGELLAGWMVMFVIAKLVATAACVGVGLPIGLIGPTLVMGAALGGAAGILGMSIVPESSSSLALYVMLGMTAMMAAVLQAPLAALMAVIELTANPNIIMPAMLIIVVATMTVSQVFKKRSVFLTRLAALGLEYPPDPATQHLLRAAVASLMTRDFARVANEIPAAEALAAIADATARLGNEPRWIVVEDDNRQPLAILNAQDLINAIEATPGKTKTWP